MPRNYGPLFLLVIAVCLHTPTLAQCNNEITLIPRGPLAAANRARNFTRFKYSLSPTDSLLVRSHEDTETSIGPFDTGFALTRSGHVIRRISLREVPEIRREEPDYADSFSALAVTRACGTGGPVFFITMQYQGDMTSPALLFVLIPSDSGYAVSTLPMISGGVFEVSKSDPFHLRTWDNLHEGNCEACETAYEIVDYEIREGKPLRTRRYRTRHLYTSGDFDSRRRIRFIQ